MNDPIIIDVTRGSLVESRHRVHAAVVEADGACAFQAGDIAAAVFPRSAVKVLQALPLIETGAADAANLSPAELALACASHSGTQDHVSAVRAMLAKGGLTGAELECGCHWPFDLKVALDLARADGTPTPLHNNCSGKHAGFLCTAVHMGEETAGYVRATHPVQERARRAIQETIGAELSSDACGIDGCSIPTYAAPLEAFARGFARLATGEGVDGERARAGRRLIDACMAHPFEMSGPGRACLKLIEAGQGRVFAKTGAEGVFCGAVPELGFGFALKAEDGATRAAESAVAALLAAMLRKVDAELAARYDEMSRAPLRNWEKMAVGEVRPARALNLR
ncbi:asparaginase [Aureimonas frigidaquae]|uniref:asparaginase n=1 Tax=Aureimonas frigidaquae TaxID=424757 RepID=UPI00078489BB|nr:asparaginase [Aureimonas frigidaquae]